MPRFTMRALRTLGALAFTAALAACSDSGPVTPLNVPSSPSNDLTGSTLLPMVQWTTPLAADSVVSQHIGPAGGTLSTAGVTLVIPPLALLHDTLITMKVPAGRYVMTELQPHGLTFAVQPLLLFPTTGTNAGVIGFSNLVGVYTTSQPVNGLISVDEAYSMRLIGSQLGFYIWHFSDYAPADNSNQKGLILMGG